MDKKFLTYKEVDKDIRNISDQISNRFKFNTIVAITRGGLYPALKLSQLLNIKDVRTICLKSYEKTESKKIEEIFCADIPDSTGVLFVDDLRDSGQTINYVKDKFPRSFLATIYIKTTKDEISTSIKYIDFYSKIIDKDKWVVFPWEEKEDIS